jgi:L-aminopeptidase/D-esterase-like protein
MAQEATPPAAGKPRARDLGVLFDGQTGPLNAITDVPGVTVGHVTLVDGDGSLVVGSGPVRTGVTAIVPNITQNQVFGAWDTLNGNGELTGAVWIDEMGFVTGPILLTNSGSVGLVKDSISQWVFDRLGITDFFVPVVSETSDGFLNDINGHHVTTDHVFAVLDDVFTRAVSGAGATAVEEGNVGGGTGMICHDFKGGIGTASRTIPYPDGSVYTVGVLVQANQGVRPLLTITGVPVGAEITDLLPEGSDPGAAFQTGSIVVVIATDAPLLPHQLKRLARRAGLGVGLVGGIGEDSSGDIFIAFSTAPSGDLEEPVPSSVNVLPNFALDPLFYAVVHGTEEAIVNALVAAETMTGINGNTVHALPHDSLREALRTYNRLAE